MRQRTEPELRHRKCARQALYGSLLLTVAVGWFLTSAVGQVLERLRQIPAGSQDWFSEDWAAKPEIQAFQGYLQVDTNSSDGSELAGAEYLARYLEAAGLEVHLERLGEKKANLWAILEGRKKEAVVLHNHIDVEPVRNLEKWEHPPFSGKIDGPWIYGRGAFDMKSLAIAQLLSVLDLARSGSQPERSVIFLATGSEEVGSDLGTLWVLRTQPELVDRFEIVLTEGGVVEAVDQGTVKYWGTSYGQKRFYDLVVCGVDKERLKQLARDVNALRDSGDLPKRLVPEVAAMFPAYAPTRERETLRNVLGDPEQVLYRESTFMPLPNYLKALFRNEAYPFRVREAHGGAFELVIKLHLLPGEDLEASRRQIVPDWMLSGLTWTLHDAPIADGVSAIDSPAFQEIVSTLRGRYPKAVVGPYFLGRTATDARFFRQAGIPAYGVSPFLILTPDTLTGNNPNERVSLPGFFDGVATYTEIVRRLAGQ